MRRDLPHPWLPTPSGLCGLKSWVPHTCGKAPGGGVVSPTIPPQGSQCLTGSHTEALHGPGAEGLPASFPTQQGPCLPRCGPHTVHKADGGIRSGPAQTIKQGRALQLCAALLHSAFLKEADRENQAGEGP